MRLLHHGMTIDLDDADRRVAVIEALLFGGALPAPIPVEASAATPEEQPTPPPVDEPVVEIPPALDALWAELHDAERRELVALTKQCYRADELEKALRTTHRGIAAQHSRLTRIARKHGIDRLVVTRGTKRASRTYALAEGLNHIVVALAGRQT